MKHFFFDVVSQSGIASAQYDPHRYRNYEMEFEPSGKGGGGTLKPKDPDKVPTGWNFESFDDPANTNR